MLKETVATWGGRRIVLMDSISSLDLAEDGQVAVSGSHGGASAGEFATRFKPFAVFYNDAGVGKENAGVRALSMLESLGIASGTVAHASARIGDARDTWENGLLSHLNRPARRLGLEVGEPLKAALERVLGG